MSVLSAVRSPCFCHCLRRDDDVEQPQTAALSGLGCGLDDRFGGDGHRVFSHAVLPASLCEPERNSVLFQSASALFPVRYGLETERSLVEDMVRAHRPGVHRKSFPGSPCAGADCGIVLAVALHIAFADKPSAAAAGSKR